MELQRTEKEKAEWKKAQLQFEEEFKKASGEDLNLGESETDDPTFLDPHLHDSKLEDLLERLYADDPLQVLTLFSYDGQIDVIEENQAGGFPDYATMMGKHSPLTDSRLPRSPALY